MQLAQVLDGLGERAGRGRHAILCGNEGVDGEEGEAEAEVGGGEDGKGLGEDVGDRLVAGEVGVELVSAKRRFVSQACPCCRLQRL